MSPFHYPCLGGVDRIRTDDLLHAKQALFQLSYDPFLFLYSRCFLRLSSPFFGNLLCAYVQVIFRRP